MSEQYDLIVIGSGPAGLSAGIYGGRAHLNTLILERGSVGGRAATTREIVNYPGFSFTEGSELTEKMRRQAEQFGVELKTEEVLSADFSGEKKLVKTRRHTYVGKAVVIATGTQPRILGIPGEKELTGMGVAYCATCDAEFFQDQHVVVVGSGDQAIEESMYIAKFASRVTIIVLHNEGVLDCNRESAEKAMVHPKLEFIWNSVLEEVCGQDEVNGVVIKNVVTGECIDFPCDGVFFFVGMIPGTAFLNRQVALDSRGYILTNEEMCTSCAGVFAAGDVREKYLRQVATAVGDGASAATAAERYIEECSDMEALLNENPLLWVCCWNPDYQPGLQELAKVQKVNQQFATPRRISEIDISRRHILANKYNVRLSEERPVVILAFENGEMKQRFSSAEELKEYVDERRKVQ